MRSTRAVAGTRKKAATDNWPNRGSGPRLVATNQQGNNLYIDNEHVPLLHTYLINMAPTRVYLSIARGDSAAHSAAVKAHQQVADWLAKNASNYGLPDTIHELDDVQKETLQSMYEGENVSDHPCVFRDFFGG